MEREEQEPGGWRERSGVGQSGFDATASVIAAMEARLNECGPQAALEFLNARTRYRFTGVYHAEPPLLRNVFLFDRENPALRVTAGSVKAIEETYCGIVVSCEREFTTDEAPRDARLDSHSARESVISYAGVPLRFASGRPWGTLCHYDVRPRLLPGAELAVLNAAALVFMGWLRDRSELDASLARAGA